jgi:hypothetical protein
MLKRSKWFVAFGNDVSIFWPKSALQFQHWEGGFFDWRKKKSHAVDKYDVSIFWVPPVKQFGKKSAEYEEGFNVWK